MSAPSELLRANMMGYLGADADEWLRMLDEALAAERKATVERIRAASIRSTRVGLPGPAEVWIVPVAILDAELSASPETDSQAER